jgi:hypothetical protein
VVAWPQAQLPVIMIAKSAVAVFGRIQKAALSNLVVLIMCNLAFRPTE